MKQGLEIIYREPSFVVVNKPGGLLAVPGRGPDKQDCVTKRLKQLIPGCIEQPAVHRLDMATSGLMLMGMTAGAHRNLSIQFSQREVVKRYTALVEGRPVLDEGTIILRFRLDPDNRPHQVFDPVNGKEGITRWRTLGYEGNRTRIEFFPATGRTHQLRLHASHPEGLGCPIVGDSLYGNGREGEKMFLHAGGLQFAHPDTGKPLCFVSPAPF